MCNVDIKLQQLKLNTIHYLIILQSNYSEIVLSKRAKKTLKFHYQHYKQQLITSLKATVFA